MEKELKSYLKSLAAEWKEPKFYSPKMEPGNWKEPKIEAELKSFTSRGNKLLNPKMK